MTGKQSCARERDWSGLLKFLAKGAKVSALPNDRHATLTHGSLELKVEISDLALLAEKGLVQRANGKLFLTDAGQNLVVNGRTTSVRLIRSDKSTRFSVRNDDESPLSTLRRHKGVDGQSFLSDQQFDAGERLRADFTHGQMLPRLSANWEASVSSGRRSGSEGGAADLTSNALAARQRFETAIGSVGPDLAGALIDVCCYLKGLEQVELERHWPKRSGKFLLRAGLTLLAMHYNPAPNQRHVRSHRWGSADYRPGIS